MTLDKAILRELAVSIDVTGYLRIMDAAHRASPTGMGYGKTRFASPTDSFKLLYVAQDLQTALAEAIIRDRYQGKQKRELLEEDVEQSIIASMMSLAPLKLLDLRASGASRLPPSPLPARSYLKPTVAKAAGVRRSDSRFRALASVGF